MTLKRSSTAFFWLLLATGGAVVAEESAERFEKAARQLVQAINAEEYAAIQREFTQEMSDALPLEKSKQFFSGLATHYGKIEKLGPPRLIGSNRAVMVAHCVRKDLDLTLVLDERDKIAGLTFLPAAPPIPVPEKLTTSLRLPFEGNWLVAWGGDTKELNFHHDSVQQRFAFDFVVVDDKGRSHQGNGRSNEDYYAFGQPVLAPADGVVTDVVTGVRDNAPAR